MAGLVGGLGGASCGDAGTPSTLSARDEVAEAGSGPGLATRRESEWPAEGSRAAFELDFLSMHLPEIMGPGLGLHDVDGDGEEDLVVPRIGSALEAAPPLWFPVRGGALAETPRPYPGAQPIYGLGLAVADCDGDGRTEAVFTGYGGVWMDDPAPDGSRRFVALPQPAGETSFATSAAFGDWDADGDLDLWVCRYLQYETERRCTDSAGDLDYCGPGEFTPQRDLVYENLGDGRFREFGDSRGLEAAPPQPGLGVVLVDLSGDGRLDVLVANDGAPNQLWVRDEEGRWRDEAAERGLDRNGAGATEASMGIAVLDGDGDGRLDVLMTHLAGETDTWHAQGPSGSFRDATQAWGLSAASLPSTAFGIVSEDFDRDGWPDLAITGGHVFRRSLVEDDELWPELARYAERGRLLLGGPSGVRPRSGAGGSFASEAIVGRGLLSVAFGRAERPELLVSGPFGAPRRHRFPAPTGRGLHVLPRGPGGEPAPGAIVVLQAGGRERVALATRAGSYLSSGEEGVRFGLGTLSRYEGITVHWPDGRSSDHPGGRAGGRIILRAPPRPMPAPAGR